MARRKPFLSRIDLLRVGREPILDDGPNLRKSFECYEVAVRLAVVVTHYREQLWRRSMSLNHDELKRRLNPLG